MFLSERDRRFAELMKHARCYREAEEKEKVHAKAAAKAYFKMIAHGINAANIKKELERLDREDQEQAGNIEGESGEGRGGES